MARNNKKSRKKDSGGSELSRITEALVLKIEKYSVPITVVLLLLILSLGIYIRVLPALKYKLTLDASDPWIVYWEAKYFVEHGLTSFSGLTDVKEFWWPIGRNFLKSDYLGMPWLAAATYPIGKAFGLTLLQWVALFPVFVGAAGIILLFALIYYVTKSKIAALSAAAFFAFLPGTIVRTTVGFVEKIGFSIPFITAFYLALFAALRAMEQGRIRKMIVYAVIGGVLGGSIGFIWGGYHYVVLSLAFIVLLDPLVAGFNKDRLKVYVITGIAMAAMLVAAPRIGYRYFITNVGAGLTGALLLYYVELKLNETGMAERIIPGGITKRFHAWLITVFIITAVLTIYTGAINFNNPRLLQTVGIRHISPLQNSVQENQPTPITTIMREYGVPLLFAIAGIFAYAYNWITGRYTSNLEKLAKFFFYIFAIIAVLFNKQLAYYTQISAYYVTIAGGLGISDLVAGSFEEHSTVKKAKKAKTSRVRKGAKEIGDPLRIMIAIFVIAIVIASVSYSARVAYFQNSYRAPQILTSGLGPLQTQAGGKTTLIVPLNKAWLNALYWIKNNTDTNATIVSWWDYGFWISVITGRKTVADGATLNETQIRYLAEALTGSEGTASYIFKYKLHLMPNDTYVVFYEVFNGVYDMRTNTTIMYPMLSVAQRPRNGQPGFIVHGVADFAKSAQMLKIAARVDPYSPTALINSNYTTTYVDKLGLMYKHFPGFIGEPKQNVQTVLNTVLYKLGMWGILMIPQKGIFDGKQCEAIFNKSRVVYPYVIASLTAGPGGGPQLSPNPIIPPFPRYFQPAAISVSCPVVNQDTQNGVITFTAVVVFIYKWTF